MKMTDAQNKSLVFNKSANTAWDCQRWPWIRVSQEWPIQNSF